MPTEPSADDFAKLASAWGLPAPESIRLAERGTNNTVRIVESAGRSYVLRIYHNLAPTTITAEHRLLDALATRDLSFGVPRAIPTPAGAKTVETATGWAALTPYFTGRHPDADAPAEVELAGAALGELDAALAAISDELAPTDWRRALDTTHPAVPDLDRLAEDLAPLLPSRPVDDCLRVLAPALDATYLGLLDRLPTQIVHGDYALSNVLVDRGRVTCVLDFEVAGLDLRVNDLVAALLQCRRDWWETDALDRIAAFCRGYGRQVTPRDDELAAIPDLARYRTLGSLVWRAGRWRSGLASLAELEPRLDSVVTLDRWLTRHADRVTETIHSALSA